jgi:hypothetical protein
LSLAAGDPGEQLSTTEPLTQLVAPLLAQALAPQVVATGT